jgi:uncharacterized protein YkwD
MHEQRRSVRRSTGGLHSPKQGFPARPFCSSRAAGYFLAASSWSPAFAVSSSDAQGLRNAHNAYRAQHCVPALTWSSQLAAEAQQWADACPSNGFKHSPGAWQSENGYGENLSWGTNQSAQGAVDNWYREIIATPWDTSRNSFGATASSSDAACPSATA